MENLQGGTLALEHRYEIREQVEARGALKLYSGRQEPFDRPIWVKVYDSLLHAPPELAQLLRVRASRASELDSPGILRVVDYGEVEAGLPFVVCERTSGRSLRDVLRVEGALSPSDSVELIERLADILATPHAQGVAHGSLSPAWIHLRDDTLSSAVIEHFQLGLTLHELRAIEGLEIGLESVSALPPEALKTQEFGQADSTRPFGVAADVYALGTIAYIALSGVHPFFDEDSDISSGLQRLQHESAPSLEDLGINAAMSDAVERALRPDPDQRWPDALSFAAAMRGALGPAIAKPRPDQRLDDAAPSPDEPTRPVERDLQATLDPPSVVAQEHERREPGPSDLLLTVAIGLLLLSNLGWVYYSSYVHIEQPEVTQTTLLPSGVGVRLHSEPAGATVHVVDQDGAEKPLGETPLVIAKTILDDQSLSVRISAQGYESFELQLGSSADYHEFTVPLQPASPPEQ